MKPAELLQLKSTDQNYLALWKLAAKEESPRKNIFLTHGTFSNRKVCLGIAQFLQEKGFTCWILEWRNHGDSSRTQKPFNFETIALEDFSIAFTYLFEQEKIQDLSAVTHSGGGICLTMFLIKNPNYRSSIKSIAMFGCQAFGAANSKSNYLKIYLGKKLSFLLGYTPARIVGSPHDESYETMKQWFDWNLSRKFIGANAMDYQTAMPQIKIPILSICGQGDTFIAPKSGCEEFLQAFKNPVNQLLFCSKANGFREDYNHSRILHSQNARAEIYPKVLAWINQNNRC